MFTYKPTHLCTHCLHQYLHTCGLPTFNRLTWNPFFLNDSDRRTFKVMLTRKKLFQRNSTNFDNKMGTTFPQVYYGKMYANWKNSLIYHTTCNKWIYVSCNLFIFKEYFSRICWFIFSRKLQNHKIDAWCISENQSEWDAVMQFNKSNSRLA